MLHDLEIAYLGIEVPDPDSLTILFGDVVGLVAGEPTAAGAPTWRNDARAQRVIVEKGPATDAVYLGVEAIGVDAFDAHAERLRAAGHQLTAGTSAQLAERRVDGLWQTTTPWGSRLELVHGLADTGGFEAPLVPGGFLTDGVGFGHVVFATTAFDQSCALLTEGLGMTRSDWIEIELVPGITLEVQFFHCNARHHSIALARAPFELPQTLHHVMFETRERDAVGHAFDRAWAGGFDIANGLGRHDNDGMFSFYVVSPAGFQVEVGHGARVITDGWDDDRRYDRMSAWGHQPLTRG